MQRRKDNKGRVLKDGEVYRKSDGLYMYRWTAKNGKRHTIYDATLEGLREKEEKIQHDLADGIRIPECLSLIHICSGYGAASLAAAMPSGASGIH